ncbi:hypothetical protein EJ070_31645 [Mesorhizobium sp. M1E.F.Ca.ET.045.02.1.1]|uniref:hypothetical protein n=1 Tax=Mesorhizobium sp. M1E.F.Ca.ET.045.02.1.1 TaxID=2493672 RepID=UPI000F75661D|nr:hypothetical protein [Mesorhizobium sp. M1E.F.Ca.ET.045.02.1.1]AZO24775.1 hypothetical protein EJ070_31645 [Mesorhizobium sp. M1E.F.Ca.ET.045.02.1.1]
MRLSKAQADDYKTKLNGASPQEAKEEIEELRARLSKLEHDPRVLTPEQVKRFTDILHKHQPGHVIVSRNGGSLECGGVQKQVRKLFSQAGWTVEHWETLGGNPSPVGLMIFTGTGEVLTSDEKGVTEALTAARIAFTVERVATSNAGPQLVFTDID